VATGERLSLQLGRPLWDSAHPGADFIDDLGRTYDAIGTPSASRFWNEGQFLESVTRHLLKSDNISVIDMTGFTEAQKAAVSAHLGKLQRASRSLQIVRIGF
jgi:hypothetical protein